MTIRIFILFLTFVIQANARIWTNTEGRKIDAELVSYEDGQVTIRLAKTGKEFTIPEKKLSEEDQKFLKEKFAPKKEKASGKKLSRQEAAILELLKRKLEEGAVKAKAVKPNWDAPWPEKVKISERPKVTEVEADSERDRFVYHSPHYEFVSDVRLTSSIVREFSSMFEATFEVMKTLPMSFDKARNFKKGKRMRVLLFEEKLTYVKNGGPSRSAGCYMPRENIILVPLTSLGVRKSGSGYSKDVGTENQTLSHELVHQLMDLIYDQKGSLGWFTEGLAEYVSVSPYKLGGFSFKNNLRVIAKSVSTINYKKKTGSGLGKELELPDMRKYMLQSYRSFTRNGNYNYAMGMLLTAYFIHMDDDGSRKNLTAFLKAMREGKEGDELLKTLLAGRTWEELGEDFSQAWKKYGLKIKVGG